MKRCPTCRRPIHDNTYKTYSLTDPEYFQRGETPRNTPPIEPINQTIPERRGETLFQSLSRDIS